MSNSAQRYQQKTEGSTRKRTRKTKAVEELFTGFEQKDKFREERQRSVPKLIPQNVHQEIALQYFGDKQMIVLTGSAGSGKTMLACWYASKLWLEGKIDTIIITRPHKHLGDDYGAVKGSDSEKLLPFCMSMLMKFKNNLGVGIMRNNFKLDRVEELFNDAHGIMIVPVEKIQGLSYSERTIIIADEVQNTSIAQAKALTTRMEEGCQIIICGDPKQTAVSGTNGLAYIEKIVAENPHPLIGVVEFTPEDNCRKGVAAHLTRAFEKEGNW